MRYIDADGLVLGRMSSVIAKCLLNGEEITIVNCEKALISGNRVNIIAEYERSRAMGKVRKGPFFPRMPDRLMRRTISRMMHHRMPKGKAAMARLTIHIGVPFSLKAMKFESLEAAKKTSLKKYLTLGDVSKELGADF